MDESVENLTSIQLRTAMKFIDMYNAAKTDSKFSLLGMYTKRFGEEAVALVLSKARDDKYLVDNVETLTMQLVKSWLESHKTPRLLDSTGVMLQLLLKNEWRFEIVYNGNNKVWIGRKDLLPALIPAFSCEDDLVALVAHVRIVFPWDEMASKLEFQLISKWRNQDLTPQDVLQLLKLDDSAEKLLSPVLQIAMAYIKTYNIINRNCQFHLLEMFTEKIVQGDVALALMKAINSDSSSHYTVRLERKLTEKWLHNGKTAEDMIVLLNIGNDGHYALGSLRVQVLKRYLRMKGEMVSEIFKILKRAYGFDIDFALKLYGTNDEDMAIMLGELFIKWHGQHVKVGDDIFKTAITRGVESGRVLENSYQDFEEWHELVDELADAHKQLNRLLDEEQELADAHVNEHLPLRPRRK